MKMIRYYAPFRDVVNKESDSTEASTVNDVLEQIKASYGKAAYNAAKSSLIVVNDVSIGLYKGKHTLLKDGDIIGFLPLCGGG